MKKMRERHDLAGASLAPGRHGGQWRCVQHGGHCFSKGRRYGRVALDEIRKAGKNDCPRNTLGQWITSRSGAMIGRFLGMLLPGRRIKPLFGLVSIAGVDTIDRHIWPID
jgi:hypothetical protein